MGLHEIAEYIPIEYCEKLESSFPDIADLYEQNPYILLEEHYMIGENIPISFIDIDKHTVLDTFDMRKKEMKAAIYHVLTQNEASGDSWMYYADFKKAVLSLLQQTGHPLFTGTPYAYLMAFSDKFSFDPETDSVSLAETKMREWTIYNGIKRGKSNRNKLSNFAPYDVTNVLSERQLTVAKNIVREGGNISLLTGGPGTGKTTVLKSVANGIIRNCPDMQMAFLTPTGKAAKRIKEIFGNVDIDISTIHLFVGWGQKKKQPLKIKHKIEATDLIIIDEASMADIEVLSTLFSLVDMDNTKIIFVGDEDQLPAIGAGDIIGDLKKLGVYHERLTENYRSEGLIAKNKDKINNGDPFLLEGEDFQIMDCPFDVAKETIAADMTHTDSSHAVLTPFRRRGKHGSTTELNDIVQRKRYGGVRQLGGRFCIGDRVILTKTNYKRHYYNGDTGTLIGYDAGTDSYVVKLDSFDDTSDDIVYVYNDSDIELGYATTFHKSQGSEYPYVDIIIPEYSSFITRRMLYTAVTRAKVRVRLWVNRDVLKRIILSTEPQRRTMVSLWKDNEPLMAA